MFLNTSKIWKKIADAKYLKQLHFPMFKTADIQAAKNLVLWPAQRRSQFLSKNVYFNTKKQRWSTVDETSSYMSIATAVSKMGY